MNQTPSRNNPSHFQDLVAAIVASDLAEPRTRHIDAGYLPNRDTVIEIVKLLRELLFPGYFGRQHLTSSTLEYHVEELLRAIDTRLFEQARNAIRHHATRRGVPCLDCDQEAERIVRNLLGAIPRLRAVLATDVQAAFDGDLAAFGEILRAALTLGAEDVDIEVVGLVAPVSGGRVLDAIVDCHAKAAHAGAAAGGAKLGIAREIADEHDDVD